MSNISEFSHIHFIGIGGVSMSALAKLMLCLGKTVTGSDQVYGDEMVTLTEWGAYVYAGSQKTLPKNTQLVVFSSAIKPNDIELAYAQNNNLPTVERHLFLAEIAKDYDTVIAIAGTHGKTTTTAMLADIFYRAHCLFTAHIGGNLIGKGNLIYKGTRYLITEACEYKKNFLSLKPTIAIVLNVEHDHPDTYPELGDAYAAFDTFIDSCAPCGIAVVSRESQYYNKRKCAYPHIASFGLEGDSGYTIKNVALCDNGCYGFQIYNKGILECDIKLNIAGLHNIYNATSAYIVARFVGISEEDIVAALADFKGVSRRFQCRGQCKGARVITDYAHHPTEIAASIQTAFALKPKRLIVVFQPHTYSRTKSLFERFKTVFSEVDELYIYKEYSAREDASEGYSAYQLYSAISRKVVKKLYYYDTILPLAIALKNAVSSGDILLILGAGDIDLLADIIIEV